MYIIIICKRKHFADFPYLIILPSPQTEHTYTRASILHEAIHWIPYAYHLWSCHAIVPLLIFYIFTNIIVIMIITIQWYLLRDILRLFLVICKHFPAPTHTDLNSLRSACGLARILQETFPAPYYIWCTPSQSIKSHVCGMRGRRSISNSFQCIITKMLHVLSPSAILRNIQYVHISSILSYISAIGNVIHIRLKYNYAEPSWFQKKKQKIFCSNCWNCLCTMKRIPFIDFGLFVNCEFASAHITSLPNIHFIPQ